MASILEANTNTKGSGMVLGMAVNGADNYLHTVIALVALIAGFAS